jgi:hypothetical protein
VADFRTPSRKSSKYWDLSREVKHAAVILARTPIYFADGKCPGFGKVFGYGGPDPREAPVTRATCLVGGFRESSTKGTTIGYVSHLTSFRNFMSRRFQQRRDSKLVYG